MKLSILIVNWNTGDLAGKAINSVLGNPPSFDFEIIVVDNSSTDGSREKLFENFADEEKVELVNVKKNLGFAAGNNLAYQKAEGEYIFLLNPDTEVFPGAIDNMIGFLDQNRQAGIVGPRLINPDGTLQPSVRRFPDLFSSLLVFSGLHRLIRPKRYLMDDFDYENVGEVDQVMGAALVTRRSIVEKLGFLDQRFYLWYEEVDFCKRVKDAGYKVVYIPGATVLHHTARSFSQLSVYGRKKTVARSLVYYFKKNGNFLQIAVIRILMPLILLAAWLTSKLGIRKKINV